MGRFDPNPLELVNWGRGPVFVTPPNGNGHAEKAENGARELKGYPGSGVSFVGPHTGRLTYFGGQPSSELESVDRYTAFAAAAYCFVALRYRAEKYSEPPLMVIEESDDGEEWLEDHALADFLDAPSPDFDMGELLYLTRLYRDMFGGAVWVKDFNRAEMPARLTPFSHFETETANGRIFGRFKVKTAAGPRTFDASRIVHFREPNPTDWRSGISLVDVMLSLLNLSQRVRATARSLLENAVFPSVVIQTDKEWQPDDAEWERFKAEIRAHAQLENKGDPLTVTGGGRATVVSSKISDLLPGELMNRIEATVAAVSGVPAVVLQFLVGMENSPWSQMAEARRMCYEDTIEPLWRKDEKLLTRQLLRPVDEDPSHFLRFDTSRVRALKADDSKRAAVVTALVDVWTIDEARIYTGQEPLEDETLGAQIISHAKTATQAASAPDREDVSAVADSGKARRSSRLETKDASAWQRFDLQAKAQEESWISAVGAQLKRDRAAVLAAADAAIADEGKALGDTSALGALVKRILAEVDAWAALARGDWKAVVEPLIRSTGRSGLRALAADLAVAFDVLIPGIETYTEQHAAHLVTQITKTTREAIADTLATGLANGESMDSLRKRIEASDAAFGEARAELIARTETVGVTNGAQLRGMREYAQTEGATVSKTWLATDDERTRDSHADLNGTTLGLDEVFANGCTYPGDPAGDAAEVCNCRCTLTYDVAFADDPVREAA